MRAGAGSAIAAARAALLLAVAIAAAVACADSEADLAERLRRSDAYFEAGRYPAAIRELRGALEVAPNRAETHYALYRAYRANGNANAAFWELQETVRLDPQNLDVKTVYAGVLAQSPNEEQIEEAAILTDEIVALDPKRVVGWMVKGSALQALGQHGEARAAFEEAMALAPSEGEPPRRLADLLVALGEREEAERLYRKATELTPASETFTSLGSFLAASGRDAEAEAALRSAVEHASGATRVAARVRLADFLVERGRRGEAEAGLRAGIETDEQKLELLYALARIQQSQGDHVAASATLEQATRIDPADPQPYLQLADARRREGDLPGALAAAEDALAATPDDPAARVRKADLLMDVAARGEPTALEQARGLVAQVLAADATRADALYVRARLELAADDTGAAIESLRAVIGAQPDWAVPRQALGEALAASGEPEAGERELLRAIELEPDRIEAVHALMDLRARRGAHDEAIALGRDLLSRRPGDVGARLRVASSLAKLGRIAEAIELLSAGAESERSADLHLALGRLYALRSENAAARASFERASALEPERAAILGARAELDLREQRLDDAESWVGRALSAAPDDALLLLTAAEIARQNGRVEDARARFERVVALAPDDVRVHEAMVRFLLLGGPPDAVLASSEQVLAAQPESVLWQVLLGALYGRQGRLDDAIARFEEAVRLAPSRVVARQQLAWLLADADRDLERAHELAREAKRERPEDPALADALGWVLYRRSLPASAIPYLKEAENGLDLASPELGPVRHRLALAYLADGQRAHARAVAERALPVAEAPGGSAAEPAWAKELRGQELDPARR